MANEELKKYFEEQKIISEKTGKIIDERLELLEELKKLNKNWQDPKAIERLDEVTKRMEELDKELEQLQNG